MVFAEYPGQVVDENPENQKKSETTGEITEESEEEKVGETLANSETPKNPENQDEYNKVIENILSKKTRYEMVFTYAGNGLTEEIDVGNGETIQKKVRGFEKKFEGDNEGKSVNVRESENGAIVFTFLNGKNPPTTITLSNVMNVVGREDQSGGDNKTFPLLSPTIKIDGDPENLPNFLKNPQGESIVNGEIKLSNDNAETFTDIFKALHDNIIQPKIEEIHGYVQNILNDEDILKNWLSSAINSIEEGKNVPTQWETFIDGLIDTGVFNSDLEINDTMKLGIKKALVSLSVLLSGGCTVTDIKEKILEELGYSDDEFTGQKGVIDFSNEIGIEGIPVVNEDVWFCISYGNILVELAKQQLTQDKQDKEDRNFEEYGGETRLNKILDFLNK